MADQAPDPQIAVGLKMFAPYAPGLAGTIVALLVAQNLTWRGVLVSAIVGLCAVLFGAPALTVLAAAKWPVGELPLAIVNLIGFLTGLFGMAATSGLVQAVARYAKNPFGVVRIRLGPVEIGETGEGGS